MWHQFFSLFLFQPGGSARLEQHLGSLGEEIKDSAVLGRGALPQKALESVLKTAAFPQNLETGVSLRFREPSDAVVMQLEQSWVGICVRAGVSLHHHHLLGVFGEGRVSST